jgi:hypothetical protein
LNRLRARRRRQKHAAWRISRLPVTLALMLFFSTGQSLWISGTLIIGGGTLLSTVGPALVRRYVALDRLTINNEIAGFKFATVGVLYAVLLAFVVIVVWEKFSDAEANVVREAGAAENLYRLSLGLGDFSGPDLRKAVATYLKAAMADDWPAMEKGIVRAGGPAKQALDAITACSRLSTISATAPSLRRFFVSSIA